MILKNVFFYEFDLSISFDRKSVIIGILLMTYLYNPHNLIMLGVKSIFFRKQPNLELNPLVHPISSR